MKELQNKIIELEQQIFKMKEELSNLSSSYFKNNFSSSQTFNKDSVFSSRLRVPVFSAAPTVAEVGDIMAINGVLYICTTASTDGAGAVFTLVGSQ